MLQTAPVKGLRFQMTIGAYAVNRITEVNAQSVRYTSTDANDDECYRIMPRTTFARLVKNCTIHLEGA